MGRPFLWQPPMPWAGTRSPGPSGVVTVCERLHHRVREAPATMVEAHTAEWLTKVPRDMLEHVQFPKDLLSWIEDHHGLASWVEALGVTVAILGSVGVARWQDWRIRQREREQQIRKGKSVAGCLVPILNTIDFDVRELLEAYRREPRMTVGELRQPQFQFRALPFLPFVLDNAHLLPGNAIIDVPQLLSLRELAVNNIQTGLSPARGSNDRVLSDEEVRVITKLLGWMQKLIADIYGQLEAIHETSITQLLEQELRPKSRRRS